MKIFESAAKVIFNIPEKLKAMLLEYLERKEKYQKLMKTDNVTSI